MDHERIILEMLERIKALEEKVGIVYGSESSEGSTNSGVTESAPTESISAKQGLTQTARDYIDAQKLKAKSEGKDELILLCNDIQKALGVTQRPQSVCRAMYDRMRPGDEVISAPKSGFSTTVKVKYYI